ncbi:MAG TPA: flagellar biosynthesis repressor FlbT [Rhodoblastus sp.]|nr:flagellar biosynthesis repressor FlbT [Rhodoblastus sp.]
MKITLRAGEKIYVNGAVFSVDRRVSLHLLNDVTFLLENHVMQAAEATSLLRQAYFAIQTMLMDPGSVAVLRPSVLRMLDSLSSTEAQASRREAFCSVGALLRSGRAFEALRAVRALYRAEEAGVGISRDLVEEKSSCN